MYIDDFISKTQTIEELSDFGILIVWMTIGNKPMKLNSKFGLAGESE